MPWQPPRAAAPGAGSRLRSAWRSPLVQTWGPRLAIPVSFLICAAIVLLSAPVNDDEMYLAAGALVPDGTLYADFAYLQAPYMPYVYGFVFELVGSSYFVLLSRLTEIALIAGILALTYRLAHALSGNAWYAAFAVFCLANASVFQETIKSARNNNMAILLCLAALYCIERFRAKDGEAVAYAGAGALVGAAVGVKLTYLVMVPFLLAAPWLDYRWSRPSIRLSLYAALGLALGLVPAALLCAAAGVDAAGFNNVTYHRINALWREDGGYGRAMTLLGKLQNIRQEFKSTSMGLPLLLCIFLAAGLLWRPSGARLIRDPAVQRYGWLALATIPMFVVPTPVWAHYFPMFVLALIFLSCVLFSRLGRAQRHFASLLVISAAAVLAMLNLARDGRNLVALASPENWNGIQVHRDAETIARSIDPAERGKPVATLAPIYPLEAGLPIYKELATGSFAYRIGEYLSPDTRRKVRVTSTSDLDRLLKANPPSAILVGAAPKLEEAFERFARSNGFTVTRRINDKLKLYTRK